MASTTGQVLPDAKLERRTRRRFTEEEKLALLDEFGSLSRGEKGAWLRRKGHCIGISMYRLLITVLTGVAL